MLRTTCKGFVTALLFSLTALVHAEPVALPYQNLTLLGELRVPEGKKLGDGPLVLMTHGTLAHGRMEIMQSFQDLLAAKGFSSVAITLGMGVDKRQGMFDCAAVHTHKHTDAMGEIGAWLAWAKQKNPTQVILLGHSRGGNQTAWFAAEHTDPAVSKVILVAPMTWSKAAMEADYKKNYGRELGPVYARAAKLEKAGKAGEPLKGVGFLYCPNATATAGAFADYYRNEPRFDTPTLLEKIAAPILVIAGSEDTVVADLATKVKPLADGKKVSLHVVEGADHFFRDLYAEEAVDAMAAFIGK